MDYMTTYYSQSGSNHNLVNLPIDVFFSILNFPFLKFKPCGFDYILKEIC